MDMALRHKGAQSALSHQLKTLEDGIAERKAQREKAEAASALRKTP